MTFTVFKASDYRYEGKVTVNTLEDLKAIYCNIIIDFDDMVITIYDDYID